LREKNLGRGILILISLDPIGGPASTSRAPGGRLRERVTSLSIVVPAYNEAALLPACLDSARAAAAACGLKEWELIVCDNASSDATARLAAERGAKVVFEPVRRIARSRNAGAAAASGEWLLFIDADSILSPASLRAALDAAESARFVGGGSLIDFDRKPWWGAAALALWSGISRTMRWAAGSFVFCRADAFRAVGGFPPELAAAEEIGLSAALKRWGAARGLGFVILTGSRHVSSGRKFYIYSPREWLGILWSFAKAPRRGLGDNAVNRHLYDGRR
jgi:glycosyltransferase involved in cell wall biosynthesis